MKAKKGKAGRLGPRWKSRIVGHAKVDPHKLKANPLNWRVHPSTQQRAMRDALEQLGVLEGVIVNKRTGHIIDGHMRNELAIENDEPLVDVTYVDLSPDEEKLALSIINPMAELAATDPEKLGELLGVVKRNGGPLDELLAELERQAAGAILKSASDPSKQGPRVTVTPRHLLRLMLESPDIAIVERAIAMTGKANRGEALLTICRAFVGGTHGDEGHDAASEDSLEDQLAQALGAKKPGRARNARGPREDLGAGLSAGAEGDRVRARPGEGGDPVPAAPDLELLPGEGRARPG